MDMHRDVKPGIYRHFKGNEYEVVGTARHSETEEELVVYRALYGDGGLWVRPVKMFCSEVDKEKYPDCNQVYRFERVADATSPSCSDDGCAGASFQTFPDARLDSGELVEAKRQIDSVIHKLEATLETLLSKEDSSRCKSQITLARRRLKAFETAQLLIEDRLD